MRLASSISALLIAAAAVGQTFDDSNLPLPPGIQRVYVDAMRGDDANDGSSPVVGVPPVGPKRSITNAYASLAGNPAPAVVVVSDGIYAPSNGESFPIFMRDNHLIMGRNAHTVIVDGEGAGGEAFRLLAGAQSFDHSDGPYLQRLSIRNFNAGIRVGGPDGMCHLCAPTFEALVMYNNGYGIYGETAEVWVFDCTITQNTIGIYKHVPMVQDCCVWIVTNTIVIGNVNTDLWNFDELEVTYCDIDPANCFIDNFAIEHCGWTLPKVDASPTNNVNKFPVGFVQNAPSGNLPATGLLEEFDFRLLPTSGVIGKGISTGALWDGEAMGNFRDGPLRNRAIDIGADQYNALRVGPLARGRDPFSIDPLREMVGVSGADQVFTTDEALGSVRYNLFHRFDLAPVAPINPPPPAPIPGVQGTLWVKPFLDVSVLMAIGAGPLNSVFPLIELPGACGPLTVNPFIGYQCVPVTVFFPFWTRSAMQFMTLGTAGIQLTEYQDHPWVF